MYPIRIFSVIIINFMDPFYGWGSTASKLHGLYEEVVYFLPLSSQKFLVLIWSTLEGWKAESNLEPPSGSEHGTPGLWIKRLKHKLKSSKISKNLLPHIPRTSDTSSSSKLGKNYHVSPNMRVFFEKETTANCFQCGYLTLHKILEKS